MLMLEWSGWVNDVYMLVPALLGGEGGYDITHSCKTPAFPSVGLSQEEAT